MLRSVVLATVVTTVLAASLTACGGDESPEPSPTPDPAPTSAAEPDGVSATEPGTALEHGDPATLVWQPANDLVGALELTVEAVRLTRELHRLLAHVLPPFGFPHEGVCCPSVPFARPFPLGLHCIFAFLHSPSIPAHCRTALRPAAQW